jgi:hypothetical protein
MEWLVEYEGQQMPLDRIWSDELARIVGPLKSTIEKALARAAEPQELAGLKVVVYAEDTGNGASWGFKFAGSPAAVGYAVSLVGEQTPIVKPSH